MILKGINYEKVLNLIQHFVHKNDNLVVAQHVLLTYASTDTFAFDVSLQHKGMACCFGKAVDNRFVFLTQHCFFACVHKLHVLRINLDLVFQATTKTVVIHVLCKLHLLYVHSCLEANVYA